jgi:hypothetical protein|tara:strand:+ start:283 stop:1005 length:723 start_codon:yes stop_codon:yes gene_type:complete
MRILFILLIVFQFNSLKADEINYLLKIPNLKTFSLNNENGIKYLIAKKNFKIGVQNNISCDKLEKKNLDNKFSLIKKNLDLYDNKFLKKINLRFVVLCQNLLISKINTAGIPDLKKRTLILDLEFNEKYFERVIHHEVFHLIHDSFPEIFSEEAWSNLNKKNFKYADCSTCTDKLGLDIYKNTNGFLTEYSKTIPSEDMAEVYSFLITGKENIERIKKIDPIIFNKVEFIESKIKKINNL